VRREGDDVRTRWRGILNGPSAGVDGGMARSDTRSVAREARRAARLSGWHCQNTDMGDGAVGTAAHEARRPAAARGRDAGGCRDGQWHADRRAQCGERETDRWVLRVSDFRIKIYSRTKIAQKIARY
jgi:hypothetical protein